MLTIDKLNQLATPAETKARKVQNNLTERIARWIAMYAYFASIGEFLMPSTSVAQFNLEYANSITELSDELQDTAETTIRDAARITYDSSKPLYDYSNRPFVPYEQNTAVTTITDDAVQESRARIAEITPQNSGFAEQLENRVHFTPAPSFYDRELTKAINNVTAGIETYSQAIRRVVKIMSNSGIRTVTYPKHTDRIDVVARRSIMTGINNMALRQAIAIGEQSGTTLFEITYHSGHRPSHGWGGRRFSLIPTQLIDLQTMRPFLTDEQTWERYGGGVLGEFNCRHYMFPITPDETPIYDDEQLYKLETAEEVLTKYNEKEYTPYKAEQKMRALEREMRAVRADGFLTKAQYQELRKHATAKQIAELQGDEADPYTLAKIRYQTLKQEYARFADSMGRNTEMERVYYDMLGRVF